MSLRFPAPPHYRLHRTFGTYRMGPGDRTLRLERGRLQAALHTPEGPASFEAEHGSHSIRVQLWGDGADWLRLHMEALLGLRDDPTGFSPRDPSFRSVWKRTLGIHLPTLPVLFPRLVQVVLLQLVTTGEGQRAWSRIVRDLGSLAPGPTGLRLPPRSVDIAGAPWVRYVADGVPHKQARTLVRCARTTAALEASGTWGGEEAVQAVAALPGIGPWSVGYLRGTALGDPDAVITGDFHLPHSAAWILAGRERGTDEEMLDLLEPYRGHRFRVIRALWASGIRAPRRGPKRGLRPLPGSPGRATPGRRSNPASPWLG